MLGHHYQRDEVIAFADVTGDSFKLARDAAARPDAPYIVFCGVHFMAESADILTSPEQQVVLPDLAAGCSMADMAAIPQVEDAWDVLADAGAADGTVPVTYMNSTAAIKGFTRQPRRDGLHLVQRRAGPAVGVRQGRAGALPARPAPGPQHRGAASSGCRWTTACCSTRTSRAAGCTPEQLRAAKVVLWRGHCSVHGRFTADTVAEVRARVPGRTGDRAPGVPLRRRQRGGPGGLDRGDHHGVDAAPAGSKWAVGTELNLVRRLALRHPEQEIVYLDRTVCFCSTMNRIDLPHLVWALENLAEGRVVNRIQVDPEVAHWARVGLDRMLALPA